VVSAATRHQGPNAIGSLGAAERKQQLARLDDAARAGWLYYVAGCNQEEVARKLGISRQTAQRLVSMSVAEGLIKVRLDHPIGRCLELSEGLKRRFGLVFVDVVPALSPSPNAAGLAQATAAAIEQQLSGTSPIVMAIGTGRALKAAVEQLRPLHMPQHKIVSLTGNISPDGSAAYYNVIFNLADRVRAQVFPMPLPVIASSARERRQLHDQPLIQQTLRMAETADVAFVGIGNLGETAPLHIDGFVTAEELSDLRQAGAVGEIVGWAFGANGALIAGSINGRVASAALPSRETSLVVGLAAGEPKLGPLRAALRGRLINGLITDEFTAASLLEERGARYLLETKQDNA
jgi:DNA-binding transcriptional regulator LsrR (DeoR family)